jgi:proline iminopeptidase
MRPEDSPRHASTFALTVPGAVLHVVSVGSDDARPLLVLHGGPGEAHDYLRPHLDRLVSPLRRVVYYDQRGGGRSPLAGTEPPGWQEHAADVDAVRRHLGVDRVDVLGFSWGALLALLFALDNWERVGRMVLVSPPPIGSGYDEEMSGNLRRAAARPEVVALLARLAPIEHDERDAEAARRARFAGRVAPYFADPVRALELAPVEVREHAAAAIAASLRTFDLGPRLTALRSVPTLVVRGAEDPLPSAAAADVAERLGAHLVAIERSGHVPFVEAEDVFLARVTAFLDGSSCP